MKSPLLYTYISNYGVFRKSKKKHKTQKIKTAILEKMVDIRTDEDSFSEL